MKEKYLVGERVMLKTRIKLNIKERDFWLIRKKKFSI